MADAIPIFDLPVTAEEPEPEAPCAQCGAIVTRENRHHTLTVVSGARVSHVDCRPHCSVECMAEWQNSGADAGLLRVEHPEEAEISRCPGCSVDCLGPEGIGCLGLDCPTCAGRSFLVGPPEVVRACTRCWGVGHIEHTPWVMHTDEEHPYNDGELRMYMAEQRGDETLSLAGIKPDQVVEMYRFDSVSSLNAWWREPRSPEEAEKARAELDELKAKAWEDARPEREAAAERAAAERAIPHDRDIE